MRRGEPSRKRQRESERRFEQSRRHDSARVLEGLEDPRLAADRVVAEVAASGQDVRERRPQHRAPTQSSTTPREAPCQQT